ncbi:MAG TPA: hypothetical protein VMO17_19665 [Terriglobia bacterium]|nr:hypothetical protein [Terriglobia bacterium]
MKLCISSVRIRFGILLTFLCMIATISCARAARPEVAPPADFGAEAKLLYRVVACSGDAAVPARLDPQIINAHCQTLKARMARYRRVYLSRAQPFLATLRPDNLPDTVVYPFGGGDLLAALTTYPNARRITTLSLELSGDPRRIMSLDNKRLSDSLDVVDRSIGGLLTANDSTSETLKSTQQGDLPGQLSYFLVALAVHGYEPVSLRYFRVESNGSLHYYSEGEIRGMENRLASAQHREWTSPDFSEAFANSELAFRPVGGQGPLRIHRHIGANLANSSLKKHPGVLRYLESQGRVAAMTKAASYCLWNSRFSFIRNYLLANMVFMISDGTGIPPEFAHQAGFVQETYGRFNGAKCFDDCPSDRYSDQFQDLWASQPERKLGFRYGYLDTKGSYHLLVTRRAPVATP